jgi:hypothetical protein
MTKADLERVGGRLCWRLDDGRLLPLVAGGAPDDDDGDGEPDPKPDDPKPDDGDGDDGARTSAAKARREAKELRDRLRAVEEERDRLKAAQMTDQERLEARAKAAEERAQTVQARLRKASLRAAVADHASALGIVDPTLAARLLDDAGITYNDDDEPDEAGVKAALRSVIERHPVLTRGGDSDAGRREPAPGNPSALMNEYLRGARDLPAGAAKG